MSVCKSEDELCHRHEHCAFRIGTRNLVAVALSGGWLVAGFTNAHNVSRITLNCNLPYSAINRSVAYKYFDSKKVRV